ncbi:DUF6445 family protein [Inhella sp.]|uniref:DUF6445 family protein n=1 Tax=Inhella sp. TaxID=1921806 RepID=UPI0035B1BCAA
MLQRIPVPGEQPCVLLDEALDAADELVALACHHRDAFAPSGANRFPGPELPLPESATRSLVEHLSPLFVEYFGARELVDAHARLSIATLQPQQLAPIQRLCHRDRLAQAPGEAVLAGVLYLFRDERLGGTSFFEPVQDAAATESLMQRMANATLEEADALLGRPSGYLTESNRWFRLAQTVPARWNRFIFYDGCIFHGSHIDQPELLHEDPMQGRLTLNLFLRYRTT